MTWTVKRKHSETNNSLVQRNVKLSHQLALVSSERDLLKETVDELKLENALYKGRNEELQKMIQTLLLSQRETRPQQSVAISPVSEIQPNTNQSITEPITIETTIMTTTTMKTIEELSPTEMETDKQHPTKNGKNRKRPKPSKRPLEKNHKSKRQRNETEQRDKSGGTCTEFDEQETAHMNALESNEEQSEELLSNSTAVAESSTETSRRPSRHCTNKRKLYVEPSTRAKLRRGDATTFGIDDVTKLYKCFDKPVQKKKQK